MLFRSSLGRLPGGDYAEAWPVNAAGDVVVGSSNTVPNGDLVAVRWTVTGSTEMEALGCLAGGSRSTPDHWAVILGQKRPGPVGLMPDGPGFR